MTDLVHGFRLVKEAAINEINSRVRLYQHERTGARLISVENSDENKAFGVAFPTPHNTSTGIQHILEHSVLNGSRKYPVREPFVELLKTSVNTFLNAMTFSDMTIYPFASTNTQDFYNLLDVYLDAVFYPRITPQILQQEGWHYEYDAETDALNYKGVVFNEMKGYYSLPEVIVDNITRAAALPDTPYAQDSGGNPVNIPDLTYDMFKSFHETYYHPSNAHFFFYGDDDPTERLRRVDEFIVEFEARPIDATLPLQKRFDAPRSVNERVDAGEHGPDSNKGMVVMSWITDEVKNNERMLELELLADILLDSPASPVRMALIDSGLGEDLANEGTHTFQRQAAFNIGLKGIVAADAPEVEKLILDTLRDLVENGLDKATVEAALNTLEFERREKNTGSYPRGLVMFIEMLPQWLHGGDPFEAMAFELPLSRIRNRIANEPGYLENLINVYLLNNPHRVTVTLTPDPAVKVEREENEKAQLTAARKGMNAEQLARVQEEQAALELIQNTPDRAEDLAKIPTLRLNDLDRSIKRTPTEKFNEFGAEVFYHDLPTSGVAYVDVGFNLYQVPSKYLPYFSLFGRALLEMGTANLDFIRLVQWIGAKTGGIGAELFASSMFGHKGSVAYFFLRAKAMQPQTAEMMSILREVLLTPRLDNQERFYQIVLEEKAQREAYLGLAGHGLAQARLNASIDDAGWLNEQTNGVTGLLFIRELAERIQNDWPSVLADLEAIRSHLVSRNRMIVNVTADHSQWEALRAQLKEFIASLPVVEQPLYAFEKVELPRFEAFTVPTQVNFVGKGANLRDLGYQVHGSHIAAFKHMNLDYLWNKIRVQGGAYGGRGGFNPFSGAVTFLSWQDPNLNGTLDVYDNVGTYLQRLELDTEEMERAVIGAVGQIDRYLLPDAKGFTTTTQLLINYTDEDRQRVRDELFSTTLQDFHRLGEALSQLKEKGRIVVTGSPQAVEKANEERDEPFTVTNVM